jgi:amino acid transporter
VAAGMDALASLDEAFRPYAMVMAVVIVMLVAVINLRGVSESGTVFAIPTYAFLALLGTAISAGVVAILMGGGNPLSAGAPREPIANISETVGIALILRAFANGCTALTGVEAISNGVQAFKAPQSKNASRTLLAMGLILGSMFMGVTLLARHYGFVPHEDNTIPAQLGAEVFGDGSALFIALQIMTAGILILAANTSFADFPRLAAILARDGYMPRIFHARGNRLVFNYGVIVLAGLACVLLIMFNAQTTQLIPLYALGVFLSFTLSQSGMVLHWRKTREPGWRRAAVVNGAGAIATLIVLLVILEAKFFEGAWLVVILIPAVASGAWFIGRFYRGLARALHVEEDERFDLRPSGRSVVPIIVPVEEINAATVQAVGDACSQSRDVRALHVAIDPDERSTVAERWRKQVPGVPMVVIESPYRTVSDPIAAYVKDQLYESPHEVILMIPVVGVRRRYQRPLVNQSLKGLAKSLGGTRHVTVITFPFSVGSPRRTK